MSRVNTTAFILNNIPFTTFVVIDGFTYALSVFSNFTSAGGGEYFGGVIITNVSIPDYPIVLKTITNGTDGYTKVHHPTSITTATIGSSTYALVTSASSDTSASLASLGGYSQTISRDDGVQIIDITNPSNPTAVSSITDGVDGFTELKGAASIITTTIGSSTYALVASSDDDGVQIIDITNPSNPTAVSSITDGVDGFTELEGAIYITTTTTINSSTYALVAGQRDHGIQIIDITDPYVPFAVSSLSHGPTYSKLVDASSIATTTMDSSTYAFVTSPYNHVFEASGVQIIDITNPYAPTPVSTIVDNAGGYTELDGANFITTITIDSSTYALVTARDDDGVQIINLESPMSFNTNNPNPAYAKAGDTLAFGFTANDVIASHTTQFLIPDQTP